MDVGVFTLDRKPSNYHAEVEQAAFNPSNVLPGMGYSPDKMLQGRLLSYPDAHRYRIGTNYDLLPINAAKNNVANYNRDGSMRFDGNFGDLPNYEPNSFGGPKENPQFRERPYKVPSQNGETIIARYDHRENNDDYTQAGDLWRLFPESEKDNTAKAIASSLGQDAASHPEAAAEPLQEGRSGLRGTRCEAAAGQRAPRVPPRAGCCRARSIQPRPREVDRCCKRNRRGCLFGSIRSTGSLFAARLTDLNQRAPADRAGLAMHPQRN